MVTGKIRTGAIKWLGDGRHKWRPYNPPVGVRFTEPVLIVIFLAAFALPWPAAAYPLSEKAPSDSSAPINVLGTQPTRLFIPQTGSFANKILLVPQGDDLEIVDLETWTAFATQPEAFLADVADAVVLSNGTSIAVGLTDGDVARIELDAEETFQNTENDGFVEDNDDENDEEEQAELTDSREITLSEKMTTAGIDFMVPDPDNEVVYMVNSSGFYFEYNFNTSSLTETELTNPNATTEETDSSSEDTETTTSTGNFVPTDMAFAASSSGDKILITTTTGDVLILTPNATSFTTVTLSTSSNSVDDTTPNFADIALMPDNEHALIVDSDNNVIWVFSLESESFIDQVSGGSSNDPIDPDNDFNATFTDVHVFADMSDNIIGYVAGENGLTLLDMDSPDTSSSQSKVVDGNAGDAVDDQDPITLSSTPGPFVATTTDVGYLFTANTDTSLSVLTENPWIFNTSLSAQSVTLASSTFTVTFQSDQAGTYEIFAGSSPDKSGGTELIGDTAFTDTTATQTTASIDINGFSRDTFKEGSNKIYIFVTDGNGRLGHTATILSVDRPPEAVSITGVSFGNKKAYVNFIPSPDEDLSTYNLFAEPAENQSDPSCPGTLTFASANTISGSIAHADCGGDLCEAVISSLTNDTDYCVAVQAVDAAGQTSALASFSTAVTPEQTVGPAGFFGETSCSLNTQADGNPLAIFTLLLPLLALSLLLRRGRLCCFVFFLFLLAAPLAHAAERTPQSWTLELRGGTWFPTDAQMRGFIGDCCHFGGEVEFGFLHKDRYNVTASTGLGYKSGNALGIRSGGDSSDKFSLLMIPVRLDFIYRFDFKEDQVFLPYVRSGPDMIFFRENTEGDVIKNFKFGLHAGAGLGFLLDRLESLSNTLEADFGINDVYLTVEGRYAFINNFKSTGLDLSGFYPYLGLLFEF